MTGRILVVDDVATNRLVLREKLTSAYYDVSLAQNGTEGLQIAHATLPDLILLDVIMPDIDGFSVCRTLKKDPLTEHIPIVMITALEATEVRIRGLESGADDFLAKPINDVALFARVRNLMREKMMVDELRMRGETSRGFEVHEFPLLGFEAEEDEPTSIVLVPGSAEQGYNWQNALKDVEDSQVVVAKNEREALDLASIAVPDVFVVNHELRSGGDGLRLLSQLRAQTETRQSAILLVVDGQRHDIAAKGLDLGASDYLGAPFEGMELVARVRSQIRRKRYSDQLRANLRDTLRLAAVDPLTGLYNRRYAKRHMAQVIERANTSGADFAVMMLDLDRFKQVNDTHGHAAGDAVLREFSRRLQENVRGVDLVARMGGEEFFVAMPDVAQATANAAAERIRDSVESLPFSLYNDTKKISVTVSVGVAMASSGETDIAEIMLRADNALFASKRGGRNRITFSAEAA